MTGERRSGIDTRSENEKQLSGERRSRIDRRSDRAAMAPMPSSEQLALFARRLRRAMRDEKSRSFFGVASGEGDFTFYSDVVRPVEWIESLPHIAEAEQEAATPSKITLRKAIP